MNHTVRIDCRLQRTGGGSVRYALELNREGKFKEARAVLEKTARRIDGYAGDDAELQAVAAELGVEGDESSRLMDAKTMKQRCFASYSLSTDRMPDGKARR